MSYSLSEIENRVYEVLDEAGMTPAPGQRLDVTSGKLQRFQVVGDRNGTKNGALQVYIDERPGGWVENWKTGEKRTFTMKGLPALSPEQNEKFRQDMEAARVARAEETIQKHAKSAQKAKMMWSCGTPADPSYPYLEKKNVPAYTLKHGPDEVKEGPDGVTKGGTQDVLYVPLYTKDTKGIINLQQIYKNGFKCPVKGGDMKGVFSPIGRNPDGPVLICEGWATGATLHKLTGYTVVCAMNAGNLPEIARMVKLQKQNREVLICADNDHGTEHEKGKNPGKNYAVKAAELAHLCAPIWPDFTDEQDGTDWNDYMLLHGEDAARRHWKQKYDEAHVIASPAVPGNMDVGLFPDINVKNGKPLGTIENVEALLRYYKIQARYNEITKDQEITFPKQTERTDNQLEVNNSKIISLAAKHEIPTTRVSQYVDVIAEKNLYNPVCEWILSNNWDGQPRLSLFMRSIELQKMFDPAIAEMMIRKWMLSAVAAVFKKSIPGDEPFSGCGVLVLQGEQGCGKTTWFRNLAPRGSGWVGEGRSVDPTKKDTMIGALRFWITELGELESTLKRDMAMLKAFITDTQDTIRLPYAKKHSVFPRRTVFGASVNQAEFLSDMTGNRRWWCIPVKSINNEHKLDMQQVWAEVYSLYEDGYTWYPTRDEERAIEQSSWKFIFPDQIMDLVLDRFIWSEYDSSGKIPMTATEVLKLCGIDNPKSAEVRQCGTVLRKLTGLDPHKGTGGQRLYSMPPTNYNSAISSGR